MSVGFADLHFSVYTADGVLPLPSYEEGTGVLSYSAEIRFYDRPTMLAVQALFSVVTVKPALGILNAGTVIIEKGAGKRSLIYPDAGNEYTVDAILVGWVPLGLSFTDRAYRVAARWIVLDPVSAEEAE